jgi:transposase InsO family protein
LKTPDEIATERFNWIAPLVSDGLDKGRRSDLMNEIAERSGKSKRQLGRYVSAWHEGGFDALKPKRGWARPDSKRGEGYDQVVDAAIALRRESPSRSVKDIIKILELEGAIEPKSVPRSTLQGHLAAKGYSASQMRMYTKKGAAARRFQKEHRCELWAGDIKYGPYVAAGNGRKKQIYLSTWLDDATRFPIDSRFYMDQTTDAIEDGLRRGIQKYGVPDAALADNGGQYRSKWLTTACAKLGIRLLHTRPFHPEGNGKCESFNKQVGKFMSEAALMKPSSLDEYNELLRIWLEEYYCKNTHSALGGISPATAFGTDKRPLKFVSAAQLRDAFLHTDTRKVDKTGCISFEGNLYEVGLAFIGRKVEVRYDPSWTEQLEVVYEQSGPIIAKKLVIGRNCGVTRSLPEHMRPDPPETSRMLDALRKEFEANRPTPEIATMFREFWEGDQGNV